MNFKLHKRKIVEIDEHEMRTEPVPERAQISEAYAPLLVPFSEPVYPVYSTPTELVQQPQQPEIGYYPESPQQLSHHFDAMDAWYRLWPRAIVIGVGLCFVGVQILLLLHFVLNLLDLPVNTMWSAVVNALSDIVLIPFYALLPPLQSPIFARVEPYTLLAIVMYGLCSRLIVHLLKILLSVRARGIKA